MRDPIPAVKPGPSIRRPSPRTVAAGFALFAAVLLGTACSGPADGPAFDRAGALADPATVAVYEGGRITRDDLDRSILAMPPADRNEFGASNPERYRELARDLAVDRLLSAEAVDSGFTEADGYTEQLEEIRRQVVVQQGLIDEPPAFEPPTDAEIQERYEISLDAVGDVTQRFVLTIFRRRAAGQDPAPLVAEMEDLRRRVAAGESFTVLARDHSDSESRHMDGAVGWVRRGQMPPDLDRILFSLEEGVPSEPVVTAEGVHLFYIETELDGTIPEPEAVADKIRQTLVQERRALALQNLVTSTELPPGALVPSDAELRELLGNSDEETLLLRVGDAELRLGELRGKVAQRLRQNSAEAQSPGSLAVAIFNGIKQREILYTRFSGIDLPPEIQARFDRQEEIFRVQRYAEHRVDQEIASRREALQAFYDRHRNRFVSLLEVKLEALVVPLGEAPGRVMAVLESRRPELASGDLQMEDLATEVGGEVQLTERVDINTLMGHRAKAAFFAPSLGVGDVSPPYSTGQSIEIFRVLERREPEPLALEAAREQVHLAYRERHGQQIYDTLVADLLASVGFEVAEENLGAFVEGRNPPPSSTGEGNGSE